MKLQDRNVWEVTCLRSPRLREVVKTIYVQSARCKFHITVWAYFYNLCSPLPHLLKWARKTNTFALENKYHTEASKVFSIPPFLLPLVNVPMFTRKIKGIYYSHPFSMCDNVLPFITKWLSALLESVSFFMCLEKKVFSVFCKKCSVFCNHL